MFNTKTLLSALAIAAMTGTAFAQTTEDTATDQDAAPAAEAEAQTDAEAPSGVDPTTGLDVGTPENTGEPQVGQAYIREENGDWQIQCVKQEDPANEPCQLYQLLRGAENNPVAEVIIEKLPAGGQVAAGATIVVPLGTALNRDLRIAVDGSQGKVYRYAFCDGNACYSRIGLLASDISSFKAGASATVTLAPVENPEQPVNLTMSLSGFTASFDTIVPRQAPPAAQE